MNKAADIPPVQPESAEERVARRLGRIVQALILSGLLAAAIAKLLITSGAAVVFRYQGF